VGRSRRCGEVESGMAGDGNEGEVEIGGGCG
jgi:hypothetical protein